MLDFLNQLLLASFTVLIEAAPWLLVGLVAAGVLKALLPVDYIAAQLKRPGFGSVFKASLYGVPLPLCSCGVVPVGLLLRRGGASRGATTSFLVSTPEIGVDSFSLSWALLGLPLAVVRACSAFITAMVVGLLVDRFGGPKEVTAKGGTPKEGISEAVEPAKTVGGESCCCSGSQGKTEAEKLAVKEGAKVLAPKLTLAGKLRAGFRFSFTDLMADMFWPLTIGIIISAAISLLVPEAVFVDSVSRSWTAMLVMLAFAAPLYVCASASTPVAAALLLKGVSPGAVIVFLLAGPATNIATMGVVSRELGRRSAVLYVAGIVVVSLLIGVFVEHFLPGIFQRSGSNISHEHHSNSYLPLAAAVLLAGLGVRARLKRLAASN